MHFLCFWMSSCALLGINQSEFVKQLRSGKKNNYCTVGKAKYTRGLLTLLVPNQVLWRPKQPLLTCCQRPIFGNRLR